MPTVNRKYILLPLLFLILFLVLLVIAISPEIIGEDANVLLKQYLGKNYKLYGVVAFFIAIAISIPFTVDIWKLLSNSKQKRFEAIKIPATKENKQFIQEARKYVEKANLKQALESLEKLKHPSVKSEITLLSSRLSKYNKDVRNSTLSEEVNRVEFNQISSAILSLIEDLEKPAFLQTKFYKDLRDALKERYENRSKQKFAGRFPINLRFFLSTEGTSKETSATFVAYDIDEIQNEILQASYKARERLLIIGDPGAGKTGLLLKLALELLGKEQNAIPIILNLANWQSSFGSLDKWMRKILPSELNTNAASVNRLLALVKSNDISLILLFDGLDEVKESERVSCLEAIGVYGSESKYTYVISSRKEEYKKTVKDAPVHSQIEVGHLTLQQIETELDKEWKKDPPEPEAKRLLNAIQSNILLQKVVENPFYFNCLQLLFSQGKTIGELKFSKKTIKGRQYEVVEHFVETALQSPINNKSFPSDKSRYWLSRT